MKRILVPLVLTFLLPPQAISQVDPTVAAQCKDARDFQGCVAAFTTPAQSVDELAPLRGAMKQVAARLRSGTSLRDSSATFQPVVDQLALVEATHSDSLAVQKARKASDLFNILQIAWNARIQAVSSLNEYAQGGYQFYNCKALKIYEDMFDHAYGSRVINWSYKKGILGHTCKVTSAQLPEAYMRPIINAQLIQGAEDPKLIAARNLKRKKQQELCAMGPWNRYLSENPSMAAWAKSNPQLAEAKKQEIINDPKRKSNC